MSQLGQRPNVIAGPAHIRQERRSLCTEIWSPHAPLDRDRVLFPSPPMSAEGALPHPHSVPDRFGELQDCSDTKRRQSDRDQAPSHLCRALVCIAVRRRNSDLGFDIAQPDYSAKPRHQDGRDPPLSRVSPVSVCKEVRHRRSDGVAVMRHAGALLSIGRALAPHAVLVQRLWK